MYMWNIEERHIVTIIREINRLGREKARSDCENGCRRTSAEISGNVIEFTGEIDD